MQSIYGGRALASIVRYGALRMSQVALVFLGGGMAVAATGSLPGFAVSAIIGGGGAAVSTPTSSQLLGRVSPPRLAPLVFSIKQTAVPARRGSPAATLGRPAPIITHAAGRRSGTPRHSIQSSGSSTSPSAIVGRIMTDRCAKATICSAPRSSR